jgi:enoyl-CoA hydratase/carnithine racemase
VIRTHHHGSTLPGVAEIILDRPDKRNALTADALVDLADAAVELDARDDVRVILLRGEGRVFCAGFDLPAALADADELRAMLRGLSRAVRTLRRASVPVVIAAHGAAIAGGCALLGGADLVITNTDAKLGYPVVRIGISPAVTAPALLLALGMGPTRARLLDPDLITGARARELGLVHNAVESVEDVIPRAQLEAAASARKPPAAMAATKRWMNEIEGTLDDNAFARALDASLSLIGELEERELLARALGSG